MYDPWPCVSSYTQFPMCPDVLSNIFPSFAESSSEMSSAVSLRFRPMRRSPNLFLCRPPQYVLSSIFFLFYILHFRPGFGNSSQFFIARFSLKMKRKSISWAKKWPVHPEHPEWGGFYQIFCDMTTANLFKEKHHVPKKVDTLMSSRVYSTLAAFSRSDCGFQKPAARGNWYLSSNRFSWIFVPDANLRCPVGGALVARCSSQWVSYEY